MTMQLAGIDFTSRPTRRKPIVVALGHLSEGSHDDSSRSASEDLPEGAHRASDALNMRLDRIETHDDFESFAQWLRTPGPWLGVFDMPFGLPRELVTTLGWPTDWLALMTHYGAMSRADIRATFAAFCNARPTGAKFAHRAADRPAGSSPSMKWVNPPVAFMLHAGVPLLIDSDVHMPGLRDGDKTRIALEGYPGLLAREVLRMRSYKSDDKAKQTVPRLTARIDLVDALRAGRTRLAVRLDVSDDQREALIEDASGDRLDAVLCLVQAAWACARSNFGLPADIDPIEGWIVTA